MSIKLRKRGEVWHYSFTINSSRFRGSTKERKKTLANAFAAQKYREAELLLAHGKRTDYTINEATARYYQEFASHFKSSDGQYYYLKSYCAYFGKNTKLSQINNSVFSQFIGSLKEKQLSASSVNHYVNIFRKVHNTARDLWNAKVEEINFKAHKQKLPDGRTRWLTRYSFIRLYAAAAPHLKPILCFAILTGLRRGNILSLKVANCDFKKKIITTYVKSQKSKGKRHEVIMTGQIESLLRSVIEASSNPDDYVFTYKGQQVREVKRSFNTALRKARIRDFTFHDLRHTAASWLVQNGVPLERVKEFLGHEDISTTMIYSHHRPNALKEDLEKTFGSKLSQKPKLKINNSTKQ